MSHVSCLYLCFLQEQFVATTPVYSLEIAHPVRTHTSHPSQKLWRLSFHLVTSPHRNRSLKHFNLHARPSSASTLRRCCTLASPTPVTSPSYCPVFMPSTFNTSPHHRTFFWRRSTMTSLYLLHLQATALSSRSLRFMHHPHISYSSRDHPSTSLPVASPSHCPRFTHSAFNILPSYPSFLKRLSMLACPCLSHPQCIPSTALHYLAIHFHHP